MESHQPRALAAAPRVARLDPAPGAPVRMDQSRRPGKPTWPRSPDYFRLEPSEPFRCTRHTLVATRKVAIPHLARHGQGILRRALPSRVLSALQTFLEWPELFPGLARLQRVPVAAARSRHPRSAA